MADYKYYYSNCHHYFVRDWQKYHPKEKIYFREKMTKLGFDLIESIHPIVPVLFRKFDNDAQLATTMSKELYEEGIYVIGFSYPVVPKGQARIRVQISAAHNNEHLDKCISAFEKVGKRLGVI